EDFSAKAQAAMAALGAQPGCQSLRLGRSLDEPNRWLLHSEWDSVGSYRRALSAYDVKVHAVPVMYYAVDEPSAYEVLISSTAQSVAEFPSDRAADGQTAAPGRRANR
ncbi:MAG: antibiotic biosynthesis monooxygenase family protein, partial [Angustibacter sp.]